MRSVAGASLRSGRPTPTQQERRCVRRMLRCGHAWQLALPS
jgi:hypothetical protein